MNSQIIYDQAGVGFGGGLDYLNPGIFYLEYQRIKRIGKISNSKRDLVLEFLIAGLLVWTVSQITKFSPGFWGDGDSGEGEV
ncbi:hypothetical protein HYU89_04610 [Candidatus Collierbacteria bacterium]|nr:hypothetical protein [Candidatus Collierbacteria bacterium]